MADLATYDLLGTQTLTNAAATVTFSSIVGTYTDIVLIGNITGVSNAGSLVRVQFNSDTSTNYNQMYMMTESSTVLSGQNANTAWNYLSGANTGVSDVVSNFVINIQSYSNTNKYKTLVGQWNLGSSSRAVGAAVNLWRSTSAITSIQLFLDTAKTYTFSIGSTFSLYGIKAA